MAEEDDQILREIQEEMREQQLKALWKTYGKWIIGTALAVVIFTASNVTYKHYWRSQNEAGTATYMQAHKKATELQFANAAEIYTSLDAGSADLKGLASLQAAIHYLEDQQPQKAKETLETLAETSGIKPIIRDAALLYLVQLEENKTKLGWLMEIASPDRPYYHIASEFLAMHHLESGDTAKAVELLEALQTDLKTPAPQRARITTMLNALLPEHTSEPSGEEPSAQESDPS